ncbi:MAG TPA: alkaline phosphatase family protein, partial [Acidimicrobiales bacterium]|nr:alkaline phosphatase family protein [Acidimicrobiales bacterium]
MPRRRAKRSAYGAVLAAALVTAGCTTIGTRSAAPTAASGIHLIQHVVVIMQENRSFDTYFGTFPGVDGIPMSNGVPTVCVPDPATGSCVKPYVNHADVNGGGPHGQTNATADVDGGKMDGFIAQANGARRGCLNSFDPACTASTRPDVMGYHVQSDIPNYWAY